MNASSQAHLWPRSSDPLSAERFAPTISSQLRFRSVSRCVQWTGECVRNRSFLRVALLLLGITAIVHDAILIASRPWCAATVREEFSFAPAASTMVCRRAHKSHPRVSRLVDTLLSFYAISASRETFILARVHAFTVGHFTIDRLPLSYCF